MASPDVMTYHKFGGEIEEKQEADITKNDIPSLLLDEKISFIRLPLNTLQMFWQVDIVPQTRTQIQKKM